MTTYDITFERMVHGGEALGRLDDGRVVFVPYVLPGERAIVRLTETHKRWARGVVVERLTNAPERVEPRCPHFGPSACGGCHWQHADYAAQLAYKTDIVRDQIARIGKQDPEVVHPCIGMETPWHYRNHVQLHVSEDGRLGYIRADQNGVEPIDACLIMNHRVAELFEQLEISFPSLQRVALRGSDRTGDGMVILETLEDEPPEIEVDLPVSVVMVLSDGTPVTLVGSPYLEEEVAGRRWRISATSFFQTNTEMAEKLVHLVREFAQPLLGIETVVDVYGGVGLLGISLAPEVQHVIIVESNPDAIHDAHHNGADLGNVSPFVEDAAVALSNWEAPRPHLVIVDPPRAGIEREALEALARLRPPRLIYVSCDPATLARDIRFLCEQGYHLDVVQPLDMFPHTYHVETVARLSME